MERFWDLLKIIKERQKNVMQGKWEHRRGLEVEEPVTMGTVEQTVQEREERIRKEMEETEMVAKKMFSCFYCGGKFVSKKGKDQHMDMCDEKH